MTTDPATLSPHAPAPDASEPDPRRWRALWVCMAIGFITMLDVSIVNVALPSIESGLHAGAGQLQLIVAGYTLALGLALVPAGRLGDARGRRTLFFVGLVAFGLTSLGAGLARSDTMLAVMRLLQGAAAGLLQPQVVGTIQQEFHGFERGRAFGSFGATIGVSTAVGGFIPIVPFFFTVGIRAVIASFVISTIAHFVVGASKALVTTRPWWATGLEMTVVGILEAAITYGLGLAFAT